MRITITGITEDGSKFRPSDWAHRLSERICDVEDNKICYSGMLIPSISDGTTKLLINNELKEQFPEVFTQIMHFALENKLQIKKD